MNQSITLTVNGARHELEVPAKRLLVDCLRYDLGLTGTKEGCSVGVCGACTVLINGDMAASCITLAVAADGRRNHHHRRPGPGRPAPPGPAVVY